MQLANKVLARSAKFSWVAQPCQISLKMPTLYLQTVHLSNFTSYLSIFKWAEYFTTYLSIFILAEFFHLSWVICIHLSNFTTYLSILHLPEFFKFTWVICIFLSNLCLPEYYLSVLPHLSTTWVTWVTWVFYPYPHLPFMNLFSENSH